MAVREAIMSSKPITEEFKIEAVMGSWFVYVHDKPVGRYFLDN
jgi:hypothetical protein